MSADIMHTQGGGELLQKIFETLSYVLYGDAETSLGAMFQALVRLALVFGGFCGLCLAFFRQKFEPLLRSFFIPALVIVGLILVPRTSLTIHDHSNESRALLKREVPYSLGKFAAWTSSGFYHLEQLFIKGAQNPYSWVSHLSSGKNFFAAGKHDESLRLFCRECVFRDVSLGLYSKQELAAAPNLAAFLQEKTAENRSLVVDGETLSCKDAALQLIPSLSDPSVLQEVEGLFGPSVAESKELIDLLEQELLHAPKASKVSAGAIASLSILYLRNFLEAILYLIFPLVVLVSLFSLGIRTLLLWLRMVLWVSTWPIFYVAVDLFLNAVWKARTGGPLPFTLETYHKLAALYPSMEILAAVILATVPVISWFLIQGSSSALVHLVAAIPETAPAQTPPLEAARSSSENTPQTYAGFMEPREGKEIVVESKQPAQDSFQTNVAHARSEEHMSAFKNSLSSIREAVRDAAEDTAKAVKEKSPSAPTEIVVSAPQTIEVDKQHAPSHGSWSHD